MSNNKFDRANILGVKVDKVTMDQAVELVEIWLSEQGKHYIVTPNPEFVMAAQKDEEFKKVLNQADLAIPDGAGLKIVGDMNFLKRKFYHLFFRKRDINNLYDDIESTIPGVDLMEELIKVAAKKGFTTGFLGGRNGVAKEVADCLQKKYSGLKVALAEDGPLIDCNGDIVRGPVGLHPRPMSSLSLDKLGIAAGTRRGAPAPATPHITVPQTDLLFVAFGQVKQEKWIVKNLPKIPVKVAMGVGGSFDYLSGRVKRAPKWVRNLDLEWLFRLILQPRRIKRQLVLVKFVWKVILG